MKHLREQIIFQTLKNVSLIASENSTLPLTMETNTMIFRLDKQIERFLLRYVFDYATGRVSNYEDSVEVFDEGFAEPNENVNLNILKNKFRSGEKMTKLLLQYYRT